MDDRFQFTRARLDAVTCPADKDRQYVYDLTTPGLTMCRTATGGATFFLYKRVAGRPQRIRLGGFPELSIDQARKAASEMLGDIARGIDPQANRQRSRTEATVETLFNHYLEKHAKPHKKTWQDDQDQYDRYLPAWTSRRLSSIHKPDVQALHAKIGKTAPYAANRLLALLSKMFSMAGDLGHKGENPTKGVRKFKEKSRERFLHGDEMPRFFKALDEEPNETARDYIYLSLLTGARRSNVQAMRWDEVNLQRGTWAIPDTKSGEPVTVPLVDQALMILTTRKLDAKKGNPWVFPGHGKTGHLVEPKGAWAAVLKRANIADLRLHDLRRTLGSWQAAAGASLTIIGKSLGQRSTASTQVYARLNIDPVRQSVVSATNAMLAARTATDQQEPT